MNPLAYDIKALNLVPAPNNEIILKKRLENNNGTLYI
jgi:hypothetical protein